MFERFTDEARRIVVLAQEETRNRAQGYTGPEHLLLALANCDGGAVAQAFGSVDLDREKFATAFDEIVGREGGQASGHIPLAPEAKRALELALREALQSGDESIRPHHLLLGVLAVNDKTVRRLLRAVTVDVDRLRAVVRAAAAAEPGERRPRSRLDPRSRLHANRPTHEQLARIESKLDEMTEVVRRLQQSLDNRDT